MLGALPGLREVRSILASGYLWLAVAWLCIEPVLRGSDPGGLYDSAEHLGEVVGAVGIAAATSLAAYLLGSLADQLREYASTLYLEARKPAGQAIRERAKEVEIGLSVGDLLPLPSIKWRREQPDTGAKHSRGETLTGFVENLTAVARAIPAFLRDGLVTLSKGVGGLVQASGAAGGVFQELLVSIFRGFSAARNARPYRAFVSPSGEAALDRGITACSAGGHSPGFKPPTMAEVISDFPTMRNRLLGTNESVALEVDRFNSEADFRIAIFPPLVVLAVIFGWSTTPLWFGLIPLFLIGLHRARERRRNAGDLLADSFAEGRVRPPCLDEPV